MPPTHSLYWGSSVVVSQSGYNTFHEVGGSGIPHVLVPSVAFADDEQPQRAASATTEPDVALAACDPTSIANAVEQVLAAPRRDVWPSPAGADGGRQIALAVAAFAGADV